MIKSLHKALDILELLANQDGKPATPSRIAEDTGLNAPTCVRILNTLEKRGYVEKISRRDGYAAGPAIFGLSIRDSVYSRLSKAADRPIRELAVKTGSMVNISVMKSGVRYILNYHSAIPGKKPRSKTAHYLDHYETATGRLLMSVMSEEEIELTLRLAGTPGDDWPEARTRKGMEKELSRMRSEGVVCYKQSPHWIIGGLVRGEACPVAAIGFGISEGLAPEEALSETRRTTAEIEAALRQNAAFL